MVIEVLINILSQESFIYVFAVFCVFRLSFVMSLSVFYDLNITSFRYNFTLSFSLIRIKCIVSRAIAMNLPIHKLHTFQVHVILNVCGLTSYSFLLQLKKAHEPLSFVPWHWTLWLGGWVTFFKKLTEAKYSFVSHDYHLQSVVVYACKVTDDILFWDFNGTELLKADIELFFPTNKEIPEILDCELNFINSLDENFIISKKSERRTTLSWMWKEVRMKLHLSIR